MSKQRRFGLLILAAVVVGALALGWYDYQQYRSPTTCGFCQRPLYARLRVIAEIDGRRSDVCCARCAISEALQEKKPVRLIEVRDYATGASLRPDRAYFVDDSHAMACNHDEARVNEMKHSERLAFDRCSPGAFAFARREDAEAFARQNGGVIRRLAEMMEGVPQ
jgi:hypothetical protein